MLSRAACRALRTHRLAPSFVPHRAPLRAPLASTAQWARSYADNRRPDRPGQGNTWQQSDPVQFGESNKSRANPVNPNEQPEFDGAAAPERNTTDPTTESPSQPQKPLPDLRHGIPSTFGEEYAASRGKAKEEHDPNNLTEEPDKEAGRAGGGREGGELPKSAYETSTDRRRNRVANYSYIATLAMGIIGSIYIGRDWDTEEEARAHPEAPSGWTPGAMYERAKARFNGQMGYYTEPTFTKLLPDVDPAPPLTLVLSLEDLLVHSEWSTKHGWRTAKRPGVDYFIRYLSQYYELVIFTSLRSTDADPVIRKLDPFRIVMWPLFREATRYEKGDYIKDLSCLNRDLSKTIIIDTDPAHVKLQPENAIVLPKWKGQPGDGGLVALIPFLEYLAMMGVPDVRTAIKSFEGKDIPREFAIREAKAREEFNKELASRQSSKKRFNLGGSVAGALGLKPQQQGSMSLDGSSSVAEGFEQGKMLSDQFRERGQKQYEAMEKEIRENGEKWLKEMADEEKKFMDEQMKNMKTGVFSWLGAPGGGAQPQPPQQSPPSPEQK